MSRNPNDLPKTPNENDDNFFYSTDQYTKEHFKHNTKTRTSQKGNKRQRTDKLKQRETQVTTPKKHNNSERQNTD